MAEKQPSGIPLKLLADISLKNSRQCITLEEETRQVVVIYIYPNAPVNSVLVNDGILYIPAKYAMKIKPIEYTANLTKLTFGSANKN